MTNVKLTFVSPLFIPPNTKKNYLHGKRRCDGLTFLLTPLFRRRKDFQNNSSLSNYIFLISDGPFLRWIFVDWIAQKTLTLLLTFFARAPQLRRRRCRFLGFIFKFILCFGEPVFFGAKKLSELWNIEKSYENGAVSNTKIVVEGGSFLNKGFLKKAKPRFFAKENFLFAPSFERRLTRWRRRRAKLSIVFVFNFTLASLVFWNPTKTHPQSCSWYCHPFRCVCK